MEEKENPFSGTRAAFDAVQALDNLDLPIVGPLISVCSSIIDQFESYQEVQSRTKDVEDWCHDIKGVLIELGKNIKQKPELEHKISKKSIVQCKEKMDELLASAVRYAKLNRGKKIVFHRQMRDLTAQVSETLNSQLSTLHLRISTISLGENLDMSMKIDTLATNFTCMEGRLAHIQEYLEINPGAHEILKLQQIILKLSKNVERGDDARLIEIRNTLGVLSSKLKEYDQYLGKSGSIDNMKSDSILVGLSCLVFGSLLGYCAIKWSTGHDVQQVDDDSSLFSEDNPVLPFLTPNRIKKASEGLPPFPLQDIFTNTNGKWSDYGTLYENVVFIVTIMVLYRYSYYLFYQQNHDNLAVNDEAWVINVTVSPEEQQINSGRSLNSNSSAVDFKSSPESWTNDNDFADIFSEVCVINVTANSEEQQQQYNSCRSLNSNSNASDFKSSSESCNHEDYLTEIFSVCDNIIEIFSTSLEAHENSDQIVDWANNVKDAIWATMHHLCSYTDVRADIINAKIDSSIKDNCIRCFSTIHSQMYAHQMSDTRVQLAISKVTKAFNTAISKFSLGVGSAMPWVNIHGSPSMIKNGYDMQLMFLPLTPLYTKIHRDCDTIIKVFSFFVEAENNFDQVVKWANNLKDITGAMAILLREGLKNNVDDVSSRHVIECENLIGYFSYYVSMNLVPSQCEISEIMINLITKVSDKLDTAVSVMNLELKSAMFEVQLPNCNFIDIKNIMDGDGNTQSHHDSSGQNCNITAEEDTISDGDLNQSHHDSSGQNCNITVEEDTISDVDLNQSHHDSSADHFSPSRTVNTGMHDNISTAYVPPTELDLVSVIPIGVGASSKVYSVRYMGQLRAAKVINLRDVPYEELVNIFLKFTWELYVLEFLKSPRVIEIIGSINTVSENTLILEYMENGSLRKVLDNLEVWESLTPLKRHTILLDVAEGMAFLHTKDIFHRDLKSLNILLDNSFRAKISDFGSAKAASKIDNLSNENDLDGGGTIPWMPPECFLLDASTSSLVWDKRDVYSYGILTFEVLSGFAGPLYSTPWKGLTEANIISAVIDGKRPILPEGWNKTNVSRIQDHYNIMQECLNGEHSQRPAFSDILHNLDKINQPRRRWKWPVEFKKLPLPRRKSSVQKVEKAQDEESPVPHILTEVVSSVMWDGMRVVASNLPYIRALFGVCDGILGLFLDHQDWEENIKQVMNWISNIKSILTSLEQNLRQYPEAQSILNKGQLDECKLCLENLLRLAATHQSNQMLVGFSLSTTMKELIEEASAALDSAISRLNLGVGVSMLGITLRIDENVSTLISVIYDMRVDISAIAASISRIMKVTRFPSGFSKTVLDLIASISGGGEGPVLNEQMLSKAPNALKQLEATQDSYERISERPIGIGGSAKVYLVHFKGMQCAAKVVSLMDVPVYQLQDLYLKFTCELYILNLLKHPRIVELRGSISNVTEYTLLLEYMEQGSLRKVLNDPKQWNSLTPNQRHMILHNIAEGMDFLHRNQMHHRDFRSQNILLTTDFQAKISDFGMSKTSATITTFSRDESNVQSGWHRLAWMAPEYFRPRNIGTTLAGDKGNIYSYGIVIWEVISGIFGLKSSTPWGGFAGGQIIVKVLNGERPKLADGWDKEGNMLGANFYMDIMQGCFEVLPNDRPSFGDILKHLKNVTENKNVRMPRSPHN